LLAASPTELCTLSLHDALPISAVTLSDKEYQMMRNASIAVLREIGVETGGSNVQFAVNPADGRLVVIEMNPRVSRSSALASKARSEEHTSELQSRENLVCRLLL